MHSSWHREEVEYEQCLNDLSPLKRSRPKIPLSEEQNVVLNNIKLETESVLKREGKLLFVLLRLGVPQAILLIMATPSCGC
jgi:hypothetical protein